MRRALGLAWVVACAFTGCQDEEAAAECATDLDCPAGAGICVASSCVQMACEARGDCPSGTCSLAGQCVPAECDSERPCAEGFECSGGLCRSPGAQGLDMGLEVWDSLTPPSPIPPDAFRADAAPDVPPLPDAAPDVAPPPDGPPPDAAPPPPDARPLLAAFFHLTFAFDRGDCESREPATEKDLWVEEAPDGSLAARLTAPGGGNGVDLAGQREGASLHLETLAPFPTAPQCDTVLEVTLSAELDADERLSGLADWHTFTTDPACPEPVDCHRFDRFASAGE